MRFKLWFHEQTNGLNKKLIDQFGKVKVFRVNGEAVRNSSEAGEEFGESGIHSFYPGVIPEDEVWIEDDVKPAEVGVLVAERLFELKCLSSGMSKDKAYERSLEEGKRQRQASKSAHKNPSAINRPAPENVHVRLYGTLDDMEVWLVDGQEVRNRYKVDAMEGFHGYVYSWVPNNEIWIEDGLHATEIPYIILHEFVELNLMRDRRLSYEKAHDKAAKVEWLMRHKGFTKSQALALTTDRALVLGNSYVSG